MRKTKSVGTGDRDCVSPTEKQNPKPDRRTERSRSTNYGKPNEKRLPAHKPSGLDESRSRQDAVESSILWTVRDSGDRRGAPMPAPYDAAGAAFAASTCFTCTTLPLPTSVAAVLNLFLCALFCTPFPSACNRQPTIDENSSKLMSPLLSASIFCARTAAGGEARGRREAPRRQRGSLRPTGEI